MLRKEDNDWMKKYMEYEVAGGRTRLGQKRTWSEVVQKDCRAWNREDVMDHRWRNLINDGL